MIEVLRVLSAVAGCAEARHRFALDAAARQQSAAVSSAVHEALEAQRVKFAEEMQMTLDAAEATHRAALTQATNKWVTVCG